MTYLAGVLGILAFSMALERLGIEAVASKALDTSRKATRTLRDPGLDDRQKERAMRGASVSLMGSFLALGIRGVLAVCASVLTVALFHFLGLAAFTSVVAWLATWPAVILASVLVGGWFFLRTRS